MQGWASQSVVSVLCPPVRAGVGSLGLTRQARTDAQWLFWLMVLTVACGATSWLGHLLLRTLFGHQWIPQRHFEVLPKLRVLKQSLVPLLQPSKGHHWLLFKLLGGLIGFSFPLQSVTSGLHLV